jgi:isochorismate synthase
MPFIVDQNISRVLEEAQAKNYGWVFYRLPGADDVVFTCGPVSEIGLGNTIERAFCVSSFDGNMITIQPSHNSLVSSAQLSGLDSKIKNTPLQGHPDEKSVFVSAVSKAVSAIRKGELKKVVLSRTHREKLPGDFNPFSFFIKLTQAYPDAFVYLLFLPETGLWIGSSPELFLKVKGEHLETMSLAGTGRNPEDFRDKERMEQSLVSGYIMEQLRPFCKDVQQDEVSVKKAGELYHLCTRIKAVKKQDTRLFDITSALHPTPAVCGLPKEKAFQFIRENEPHRRMLYSGFLGPVNNENAELFVNLRCMQIYENEALFYAGAGIVEGSDPEAEWHETSQKMDTLRRVIFPDVR